MTREEYEAEYPLGSVNVQVDDEVRPMDEAEWTAWVEETWNADQPTQEEIDNMRRTAYTEEADPLYFKWQRGEGTEQAWLDKVAEIRSRYPDPA